MAKVLEGPGMGLMKKWGIHVPTLCGCHLLGGTLQAWSRQRVDETD